MLAAPGDRALYSVDASNYRHVPAVVVRPRSVDGVVAAVGVAVAHGVPITNRGAGTSIAGNSAGAGLVIDFSRYLDRVISVDPVDRVAVVQPGVVLDRLNDAARPHGLVEPQLEGDVLLVVRGDPRVEHVQRVEYDRRAETRAPPLGHQRVGVERPVAADIEARHQHHEEGEHDPHHGGRPNPDVLGEDRLAEQVFEHPPGEQADRDAPGEPHRRLGLQQPSQKLHERSSSKGGPGFGRLVGYAHR